MWRSNPKMEPLLLIHKTENTELPLLIRPPPVSPKRIEKMKNLKPNIESQKFWENIINGGLGTDDQTIISPIFKSILQPVGVEKVIQEDPPEEVVVSFRNLIWDDNEQKYYLETRFESDPNYWNCERESFTDDGIATNEKFVAWELEHPVKAKQFRDKNPPKQRAKRVLENEKSDLEDKTKKKKKNLSRILQDGRGNS
jgi:hypothetical protein